MGADYKTDLERARTVLLDLFRQREQLEVQIAKQRRRVAALAELNDESEGGDQMTLGLNLGGLTNSCRSALRAAGPRGLAPTELRDSLKQLNFPIHEYRNIMAAVHTVLKRLQAYGEVRIGIRDVYRGQDDSVYQWIGPQYGASRSLANLLADVERDRLRRKQK